METFIFEGIITLAIANPMILSGGNTSIFFLKLSMFFALIVCSSLLRRTPPVNISRRTLESISTESVLFLAISATLFKNVNVNVSRNIPLIPLPRIIGI